MSTGYKFGNSYRKVVVEPNTSYLEFPRNFHERVLPGSLNNLAPNACIKWGPQMVDPIEPGIIPNTGIHLVLDPKYKHPISSNEIPPNTTLYIHYLNRKLIPENWEAPVYLWKTLISFTSNHFSRDDDFYTLQDFGLTNLFRHEDADVFIVGVKKKSDNEEDIPRLRELYDDIETLKKKLTEVQSLASRIEDRLYF